MQKPEPVHPAALPERLASARECMRECLRSLKRRNKVADLTFQCLMLGCTIEETIAQSKGD